MIACRVHYDILNDLATARRMSELRRAVLPVAAALETYAIDNVPARNQSSTTAAGAYFVLIFHALYYT